MSAHVTRKSFKATLRDKPKHTRKGINRTEPRRNGNGRGNVGALGSEALRTSLHPDDPNYSDSDDKYDDPHYIHHSHKYFEPSSDASHHFSQTLAEFKQFKSTLKRASLEYVTSIDLLEFIQSSRLDQPSNAIFHQDVPYLVIRYSFNLPDKERSIIASLLLQLHKSGHITTSHLHCSFKKLFESLPDLTIDAPCAKQYIQEISTFLCVSGVCDPQIIHEYESSAQVQSNSEQLTKIKVSLTSLIEDYFDTSDDSALVAAMGSLGPPTLIQPLVTKLLVNIGFDRSNAQRELISQFISTQVGNGKLSVDACEAAYTQLLERVEDIYLDVPNVLQLLALFIARAIVDECASPSWTFRVGLNEGDGGADVLREVKRLLAQDRASERLAHCWRDKRTVDLATVNDIDDEEDEEDSDYSSEDENYE